MADIVYVVSATKNGQSEFWAAATPRDSAAAQVQGSLSPGWEAKLTGWRLGAERVAELQMAPNTAKNNLKSATPQRWHRFYSRNISRL
jgi:hypothetical protein